ncbi:MAG: MOSC domain-containing protein [Vallitaleaceae bacterium]|nr:MOSC domain-containing protein [Vallitaleaceae bacterium]
MAEIVAINISDKKGIPKKTIDSGEFKENFGLVGDAHAGNWHRQVSFLAQESIDKMTALGIDGLDAGKFAENITTIGIELHTLKVGTRLKIAEVEFEISQIGKECHQKCAIFSKIGDCIMPTEGIFAIVLKGGILNKSDKIEVIG